MRRSRRVGAAAAMAVLGAVAAAAGVLPVQYGGPMTDGPDGYGPYDTRSG